MDPDAIARDEEELRELLRLYGFQDASEAGLITGFAEGQAKIVFPTSDRMPYAIGFSITAIPIARALVVIEELAHLKLVTGGTIGPRQGMLFRRES